MDQANQRGAHLYPALCQRPVCITRWYGCSRGADELLPTLGTLPRCSHGARLELFCGLRFRRDIIKLIKVRVELRWRLRVWE